MISTKFYAGYDEEIYLSDWAEDGHLTEKKLKKLELEFLCAIDWNIYISKEVFFEKLSGIEKQLARREGLRRGWLTYTELIQMLPSFTLVKFILNNIAVMAVSYAASVITIAGAFFLASQIPGTALHRKTISAVISGQIAVQQSTPIVDYRATLLDAQPRLRRSNGIEISKSAAIPTTTTIGEGTVHNATCTALNVEAELLKLECQYRAEEKQEAVRRRQHEIDSSTRLTLPDAVQRIAGGNKKSKNAWYTTRFGIDLVRNWFALKVKYTDGRLDDWLQSLDDLQSPRKQEKKKQHENMMDWNAWSLGNYTTSIFWQLLSDNAQQSLVRLPSMWIKFI
ncbi:PREDICTED: uncharacterized protein LOC108375305 [Rhagoletis zephyria]|uniref:uncharacterized protein LOC108375305 n=1 Tax=Rhagoletis zephyria TaxID=28612 RepID=UPI0008116697|nr:PREDICTED: uncharacterized protein LOC108375305 [Rhagoletis zephyria]